MPLAKIHVFEGRYDEARIAKVSGAVQAALMNTLQVPPEDFYQRRYVCGRHMQIIHRMRGRFVHPCSLNEENTMSTDETLSYDVFVSTRGLNREGSATTAVLF